MLLVIIELAASLLTVPLSEAPVRAGLTRALRDYSQLQQVVATIR